MLLWNNNFLFFISFSRAVSESMATVTGFRFSSVDFNFSFKSREIPKIRSSEHRRARNSCLLCRKISRREKIHLSSRNFCRFRCFSTSDNGGDDNNNANAATSNDSNDTKTTTTTTTVAATSTVPPEEEEERIKSEFESEKTTPASVSSRVLFEFVTKNF